jgi:alkylmercury lyase
MEEAKLQEIGKAVAGMLKGAASTEQLELPGLLLRLLAEGRPVPPARIAAELGISPDAATAALEQSTAVELDEGGNVTAAFGLTLNPTPHRFRANGHDFYTWCALDTLYIPGVIGQTARVESTCPVTGTKIQLTVTPDGIEGLEPAAAVMAIVIPETAQACYGIRESFCNHVHFLSSREAASEWSANNQKAIVLSVDDAHKVGRIMLEYLFELNSDV